MNTREINRVVAKAFDALEGLNNLSWHRYRDKCHAMACEEERGHRASFKPEGWRAPKGASVEAAARLFVVKRVAECLTADRKHKTSIADVLSGQPSAIYAASIVANYRAAVRKLWKGIDVAQLAALDYCAFINDGVQP